MVIKNKIVEKLYDYMTLPCRGKIVEVMDDLNNYGKEGWRLKEIIEDNKTNWSQTYTYLLEREYIPLSQYREQQINSILED